jgi:hypothetical protein
MEPHCHEGLGGAHLFGLQIVYAQPTFGSEVRRSRGITATISTVVAA